MNYFVLPFNLAEIFRTLIQRYKLLVVSLLLLSFSALTNASEDDWSDNIQFHGFATQGVIFTSDNNFYGDSDHGSADFTELGINTSIQFSPKVRASAQLLSRQAGDMDDGSPRIDYAILDINFISSPQGRFGLYLGREKSLLGLYNETRDVSHTRQGVFVTQSIYFDRTRDLSMSGQGLHFYGEYFLENGTLIVNGGAGYALPDDNTEITFMGKNWEGELEANDLAWIGRILYEHDGGRWIFALTSTTIKLDFEPGPTDTIGPLGMSAGSIDLNYTILSTEYNGEKWQVTGEIGMQDVDVNNIGGLLTNADTNPLGMALQVNYKFTPQWQAYLRREVFYTDRQDKYGKEYEQNLRAARTVLPMIPQSHAYTRYSEAWVIGGRWDINDHLVARADYHLIEGTALLSRAENDFSSTTKYWNMFAASISYRF